MVRALMGTFDSCPKRFDTVGVDVSVHILSYRVSYSPVPIPSFQVLVGFVGVRVYARTAFHVLSNESLQGTFSGACHMSDTDLAGLALAGAHNDGFTSYAASNVKLFVAMFVLFETAYVGLVYFNFAGYGIFQRVAPAFPDTMSHRPGGRLRHSEISRESSRRNALRTADHEIDPERPRPERQPGRLHHSAGLDAEVTTAVVASVALRFAGTSLVGVQATAVAAKPAVLPAYRFKPFSSRFLVEEDRSQLQNG